MQLYSLSRRYLFLYSHAHFLPRSATAAANTTYSQRDRLEKLLVIFCIPLLPPQPQSSSVPAASGLPSNPNHNIFSLLLSSGDSSSVARAPGPTAGQLIGVLASLARVALDAAARWVTAPNLPPEKIPELLALVRLALVMSDLSKWSLSPAPSPPDANGQPPDLWTLRCHLVHAELVVALIHNDHLFRGLGSILSLTPSARLPGLTAVINTIATTTVDIVLFWQQVRAFGSLHSILDRTIHFDELSASITKLFLVHILSQPFIAAAFSPSARQMLHTKLLDVLHPLVHFSAASDIRTLSTRHLHGLPQTAWLLGNVVTLADASDAWNTLPLSSLVLTHSDTVDRWLHLIYLHFF